jgi:hypothetical protein
MEKIAGTANPFECEENSSYQIGDERKPGNSRAGDFFKSKTHEYREIRLTGSPLWFCIKPCVLVGDGFNASSCRTPKLRHLDPAACGTEASNTTIRQRMRYEMRNARRIRIVIPPDSDV